MTVCARMKLVKEKKKLMSNYFSSLQLSLQAQYRVNYGHPKIGDSS